MQEEAFNEFNNFNVLNKFQLSQNAIAISKAAFKKEAKIIPRQEMLHLKYQAVCFNLYSSMYMYTRYLDNINTSMNIIYFQSANNFLQSSWDSIFQMISMFNLEDEEVERLLLDEKERIKCEKKLNVGNYINKNKTSDKYIKTLDKIYKQSIKDIREINNYVKHNGHIRANSEERLFKGVKIDIQTLENEVVKEEFNLERNVDIESLIQSIKNCINLILDFINTYMDDNIDDTYDYLIGFSRKITRA